MTRLIDADNVAHEIDQLSHAWEYGQAVDDCYEIVKSAPTVDAIPFSWLENFRNSLKSNREEWLKLAISFLIIAYSTEMEEE